MRCPGWAARQGVRPAGVNLATGSRPVAARAASGYLDKVIGTVSAQIDVVIERQGFRVTLAPAA